MQPADSIKTRFLWSECDRELIVYKLHQFVNPILLITLLFQAFNNALEADSPASFSCDRNFRF
ncbi:hypothetical protein, partial [Microcoleus sp. herbarium14]|uniref:hypothetical protein n=1 Tax=Microcoleus sp. herbarium14 TaxID=3055439 RepID=UPI002FD22445